MSRLGVSKRVKDAVQLVDEGDILLQRGNPVAAASMASRALVKAGRILEDPQKKPGESAAARDVIRKARTVMRESLGDVFESSGLDGLRKILKKHRMPKKLIDQMKDAQRKMNRILKKRNLEFWGDIVSRPR